MSTIYDMPNEILLMLVPGYLEMVRLSMTCKHFIDITSTSDAYSRKVLFMLKMKAKRAKKLWDDAIKQKKMEHLIGIPFRKQEMESILKSGGSVICVKGSPMYDYLTLKGYNKVSFLNAVKVKSEYAARDHRFIEYSYVPSLLKTVVKITYSFGKRCSVYADLDSNYIDDPIDTMFYNLGMRVSRPGEEVRFVIHNIKRDQLNANSHMNLMYVVVELCVFISNKMNIQHATNVVADYISQMNTICMSNNGFSMPSEPMMKF